MIIQDSPSEIQAYCLSQLEIWLSIPRSHFSWPMDRIANKPYYYAIHVSIVEAWSEEGRETNIDGFHRRWLGDINNIAATVEKWNSGRFSL